MVIWDVRYVLICVQSWFVLAVSSNVVWRAAFLADAELGNSPLSSLDRCFVAG